MKYKKSTLNIFVQKGQFSNSNSSKKKVIVLNFSNKFITPTTFLNAYDFCKLFLSKGMKGVYDVGDELKFQDIVIRSN